MSGRPRSNGWLPWALGAAIALVLLFVAWGFAQKRLAVSRALSAGAIAYFESEPDRGRAAGDVSWFELGQPIATLSLDREAAVDAVLSSKGAFARIPDLFLGDAIGEARAAALFAAIQSGELQTKSVTTYAKIEQQATLDALLRLPLKTVLIGCPDLPTCDLTAVSSNATLEEVWLNEGPSGCEGCGNRDRYNAEGFAAVASLPRLRFLLVHSVVVTDAMAAELAAATQLQTLRLSKCWISDAAAEQIRGALPNTTVKITPADEGDAPGAGETK